MFKMAIDLGYGYVKGVNEDGKKVLFSSVVGPAHARNLSQVFDENSTDVDQNKIHVRIEENGQTNDYFVGNLAEQECRSTFIAFDEEKIYHPSTKVLLATAAFLLSPVTYSEDKPADIHLVTGLPLQYYTRQREKLSKYLSGFNFTVSLLSGKSMRKQVKFSRVDIFPQAGGAMYAAMKMTPDIRKEGSTIALIDIGTKTTDYIVFQYQDGKLQMRENLSGTTEKGMLHMQQDIIEKISNLVGSQIQLTTQDLRSIMKTSNLFYMGKEYYLPDIIEDARRDLAQAIKDHLMQKWSNQLGFIRTVFFAGGGATELFKYLKEFYPTTTLMTNSQFANVNGYMIVAETIQERISKIRAAVS